MEISGNRINRDQGSVYTVLVDNPPRETIPRDLYIGQASGRLPADLIRAPAFQRICQELAKWRLPEFKATGADLAVVGRLLDPFFGSSDEPINVMRERVRALSQGSVDVFSTPLHLRRWPISGLGRYLTLASGNAFISFVITPKGIFPASRQS